jgi:hypothetical protein
MLPPTRPALALLVTLASLPAHAELALVPVVLAHFGDGEHAQRLQRIIEVQLQLVEELEVNDPEALERDLGTKDVAATDPERLADALARLEQQALVYAVAPPEAEGELVLALFRTQDAAIIFARLVNVRQAARRPTDPLAKDLAAAARALHQRPRIDDDELAALGLRTLAPAPAAPLPPTTHPPAPTASEAVARVAGTHELGRVSLTLSPTFLSYRACQPEDPADAAPFACESAAGTPDIRVLVDPLTSPVAGEAHLELYPLPWLGFEARGSALYARLRAGTRDEPLAALTPNPFTLFAGHGLVAANLRLPFGSPALRGAVGLRAGYHLAWSVAEAQNLEAGGRKLTLLPSYASHNGLLGASARWAVGEALRVTLDIDGLAGPHLEGPTRVGEGAFALGGRAHLGLDVRLLLGLYASFFMDVSALSIGSSGVFEQAPRFTLALEPFRSGQVVLAAARAGIGLGWRF